VLRAPGIDCRDLRSFSSRQQLCSAIPRLTDEGRSVVLHRSVAAVWADSKRVSTACDWVQLQSLGVRPGVVCGRIRGEQKARSRKIFYWTKVGLINHCRETRLPRKVSHLSGYPAKNSTRHSLPTCSIIIERSQRVWEDAVMSENPKVRHWVETTLPILVVHLKKAERVSDVLGFDQAK